LESELKLKKEDIKRMDQHHALEEKTKDEYLQQIKQEVYYNVELIIFFFL
jgi:hypothetical protein